MSFIHKILQNPTFKTLTVNFTYLSLLKCLGLLFPLITYPIVMRTVGAENYGIVVYSQSIIAYFVIIINFGFDVSATRRSSESREDIVELCKIYSSITYLKLMMFILCVVISIPFFILIHYEHSLILFLLVGLCIQEIAFPVWLFQGLEKMKFITILSFLSQCLYVLLILVFIREACDYYLIPVFMSIGGIVTSIGSIYILRNRFRIKLVSVTLSRLKQDFKESLPFFASRFSAIVMEKSNVILIGSFFTYNMVAIYDLCSKIVSMLQMPYSLIAQVVYPNVAKNKNMGLIRKLIKPIIVSGVLLCLVTIALSKYIVLFLGGETMLGAIPILTLMVWYAPIVGISYLFGASTLVVCGFSKQYNLSVVYSVFFYLLIVSVLVLFDGVNLYTMAISFVLPELFVATYRSYMVNKHKLLKSN